jgi:hypothetical protein
MGVWVPSWPMFAVGNAFSFFLTPRKEWRTMAQRAAFQVVDEGVFNNTWFVLVERPALPAR